MKMDDVKKWITKAESDLKVVKHEMEGKEPVTDAFVSMRSNA